MLTGAIDARATGPLIQVRVAGRASSVAHEAARAELDRLLSREGRYGLLVDVREAGLPGFDDQKGLVELLVRNRAHLLRSCAGLALIVRGRAAPAILGAVGRFVPTPVPFQAFRHAMAADAWLRERLE